MRAEVRFSIRCKDQILEQARIEESRVGLAAFHAVPRVTREVWGGKFSPYLETHLEILRDLVEVFSELISRRWPIEGRIVADGPKERLSVVEILAVLA